MRRSIAILTVVIISVGAVSTSVHAEEYFTLIVSGASGGQAYRETYDRWRQDLIAALRAQTDFREDNLVVLAETPAPGVGRASREGVAQAFRELGMQMTRDSVLMVVLLGHGTFDGIDAKFNLVGPDLESREWDALLDALPGRVVFVNTTAASFPFVRQLAGPGRVVIAATSSATQRYDTVFPEFFVRALSEESSDADRDGRVSVGEAFDFASAEVRRWYQRQGRLATERAILDDTGDGEGQESGADGRDGIASARVFVGAGVDPAPIRSDPALAPLIGRQAALEDEVADLKSRKAELDAETYERELERLLVELARVSREIRQRSVSS